MPAHRDRRADQVRLERFLATKISLHQRDRAPGREASAPTSRRSPRRWASTGASAPSSCTPASASAAPACPRTRTALVHIGAGGAAIDDRDRARGDRASTTDLPRARLRQGPQAGSATARQDGRAARPRPSSPTPTTSGPAGASTLTRLLLDAGAHRPRAPIRWRCRCSARSSRKPCRAQERLRGRRGRRPLRPGHRVERVPPARPRPARRDHAQQGVPRLPQRLRPRAPGRARLHVRLLRPAGAARLARPRSRRTA